MISLFMMLLLALYLLQADDTLDNIAEPENWPVDYVDNDITKVMYNNYRHA